ncbi:MAG: HIRAN domain-containing protein [Clostridia bacterium]|nr:HIRAN domain-containing protein [Clostridia bacterium]
MPDIILRPNDNKPEAHIRPHAPLPFENDIFLYGIEVAGTNHVANIDVICASLQKGERVKLVREAANKVDKYAIRIDVERKAGTGGVKLGYVPTTQNKIFARLMDAGKWLYGEVFLNETSGDFHKIVVKIYMKD